MNIKRNIKGQFIKGKNHWNWRGGHPKCLDCGKLLVNYSAKYCKLCMQKGSRGSNWKGGICHDNLFCIKCGKKISANSWYYGGKKCKVCANTGENNPMFGKMGGENNPNWQGGISRTGYPSEFNDKLKLKIRKRDNYTCQNCGMTEGEHLIVYGKVLTVHHIDYDKMNCKEDNLITVCRVCNLKANYNKVYWIKYFQEKLLGRAVG